MTEFRLVSSTPCKLYLVECPSGFSKLNCTELPREYWFCSFRSVSIDRLAVVLQQGIDVLPTNAVIYTDDFVDKAFDYGGWPKVLLALDAERLDKTFREIPSDSSEAEIQAVCLDFPTVVKSIDDSKLWCTRLPENDRRITSTYEWQYARWIPGDPWDALKGVFIFYRPEDLATLHALSPNVSSQSY